MVGVVAEPMVGLVVAGVGEVAVAGDAGKDPLQICRNELSTTMKRP